MSLEMLDVIVECALEILDNEDSVQVYFLWHLMFKLFYILKFLINKLLFTIQSLDCLKYFDSVQFLIPTFQSYRRS